MIKNTRLTDAILVNQLEEDRVSKVKERKREHKFTDVQFKVFQKLINEYTSIALSEEKKELVYWRLSKRLRILGLDSFESYYRVLMSDDGDEREQFVNAITTNMTSFFREEHHFQHLLTTTLPDIITKNTKSRSLRIWSAGCSTGEEVYSIAMSVVEALPEYRRWNVKIYASDIDSNVLATAVNGIYRIEGLDDLAPSKKYRWFKKGCAKNDGWVHVSPELQEMIHFHQFNLSDGWPIFASMDIIFCRNVIIYFSQKTQQELLRRFHNLLNPRGYLYLGHSEILSSANGNFQALGNTCYQRTT